MENRLETILRINSFAQKKIILGTLKRSDPIKKYRILIMYENKHKAYIDFKDKKSALKKYEEYERRFLYGYRKQADRS